MQSKLGLISDVLTSRRYAAVAVCGGLGLGTAYYLLTMSMLSVHFDAAVEISAMYLVASISLTVAISSLAGVNFALIAFKIKRMGPARSNSSAVLGGAFAAFTPGCPACTAPLAVVLGAVGGLSMFPMQGLELKLVSVGVLAFSVYWIARGLQSKSCCKTGEVRN